MNFDLQPFDRSKLGHIDKQLRRLVDEKYDLCLYKCAEKIQPGLPVCKQNCFKNIIIPYRYHNHMARNDEDNLYKQCLSNKFPNI